MAIFIIGGISVNTSNAENAQLESSLTPFIDTEVSLQFIVLSQDTTPYGKRYLISISKLERTQLLLKPHNVNAFLYTDSTTYFNNSHIYNIQASIKEIKPNANPYTINFKEIYKQQNILLNAYQIKNTETSKKVLKSINPLERYRSELVVFITNKLKQYIKNKDVFSIIMALTLGDKSYLDKEVKQAFSNTGAIHILAVSGLHVGLVYTLVLSVLYWLPKNFFFKIISLLTSLSLILAYCYITGMGTSVTRATLMISIYLIGKCFGKFTSIFNIIGLAATIILFLNPLIIYTISFQFSFLALISILLYHNAISTLFDIQNKLLNYVWQLIAVSFAAQILIAPLLIYYFNQISLLFWLSGILAVPLAFLILSLTVAFCISTTINFSLLTAALGYALEVTTQFLSYFINAIDRLPYCYINNIMIHHHEVAICYAIILMVTLLIKTKSKIYLYLTLLSFPINNTIRIAQKQISWKKEEFSVYHLHNQTHIHYLKNGTLHNIINEYKNLSTSNKLLAKYKFENNILHSIPPDTSIIDLRNLKLEIRDKTIIINPTFKYKEQNQNETYIILTQEVPLNAKDFSMLNPVQIIMDGHLDFFYKKRIKDQLNKHKIRTHDTRIKGAFTLKF